MISFLHSLYNGIFESSRGTHTAFCFAFTFGTFALLLANFTLEVETKTEEESYQAWK
jgi:hypothetical protein